MRAQVVVSNSNVTEIAPVHGKIIVESREI